MNTFKKRTMPWFSLKNYLIFFCTVAFVVSTCMILLFTTVPMEDESIRKAGTLVFLNCLVLSFIFASIDAFRRYYTVERPIQAILHASDEVMKGNFDVVIPQTHTFGPKGLNELVEIIQRFNIMVRELSSMETLRSDFVSNVSHELKIPLAIIQNYANLLQSEGLEETKRLEYTQAIQDATKRFSQLITNILKLNKLENQQIFPVNKQLNVGEHLRECLLDHEENWEKKELQVNLDIEDIDAYGDGDLLSLIWNNLISNAIKFTDPKGTLTITLKQDDDWIIAMVKDTGCGMDAQTGQHIFDKFYQGDTSHASSGNGLGLALVKRVIDIVQGEINVESEVGKGTTFIVRLPKKGVDH